MVSSTYAVYGANKLKMKTIKKEYRAKKNGTVVAKGHFSTVKVKGKSLIARKINKLSNREIRRFKRKWKEIKKFALSPDAMYTPLYVETYIKKKVDGGKYLTIQKFYAEYTGGYPFVNVEFYTYNKKTGKNIKLQKFAECDIDEFNEKVIKAVKSAFKNKKKYLYPDYESIIRNYKFKNYRFYKKKGKLHILFLEGEIASRDIQYLDVIIK